MKKTLYFLPGTMCDQRLWLSTWQQLEQLSPNTFDCIHLDIPHEQSIADILTTLNTIIAEEESYLVGFSLGGYLATAFNVAYPKKVGRLMVLSNMPRSLPMAEIKERERTIRWIKQHGYSGIPLKRIHGLIYEKASKNPDVVNTIKQMDEELGAELLMYQLSVTTKRESLLAPLSTLSTPVTFCIGKQDHLVDLAYLQEGVAKASNLSLTIHDEVGHMFPLEAPDVLAKEINQFFLS